MRHVADVIDLNKFKNEKSESFENSENKKQTARLVNILFREMRGIFPAFRQAWPTDEEFKRAKINWIKAFMAVGIKDIEQLRYGLQRCRLSGEDFAPNAGKFISWCKPTPENIGLPPVYKAFEEAVKNSHPAEIYKKWSHDAVYHAAKQMSSVEFFELPKEKAYELFKYHYDIAVRMVIEGQSFDKAPNAKPLMHEKLSTPEVAKSALLNLKSMLR